MKAKTLNGSEVDLSKESIDSLKAVLSGQLLTPGDNYYDESRTVWNGMYDRKPAIVVRCRGTSDVIACIRFVREYNLLVCVKGGGHHIAGLAVADGSFMIDMTNMRGVIVDPQNKIAHVQAGSLLGDVDRETQIHGLAAVLGFVSATGVAGLTLGGGFGYLTRRWGWTSDTVRGMNIVTADAKMVRATSEENTDLFWGLRGGCGNFGVVTEIDYNLYPVGPQVIGGMVAWHANDAPKVFSFYQDFIKQAPYELTLVVIMRIAPPAPWLPAGIHGEPIFALLACYSGSPEEGEKVIAPIKNFGNPVGDILVRRPYTQLQSLFDSGNPKGRRYYQKSEFLSGIDNDLCEKIMLHASRITSPYSVIMLFQIEGALNRFGKEQTATGNRNAKFVLNIPGSWEKKEDDDRNIAWVHDAWMDMKSFSSGGNYINFQSEDEGVDRIQSALGANLRRLSQLKAKWDPQNIFRTNRNIKPL